jgi:hypothetical protein
MVLLAAGGRQFTEPGALAAPGKETLVNQVVPLAGVGGLLRRLGGGSRGGCGGG